MTGGAAADDADDEGWPALACASSLRSLMFSARNLFSYGEPHFFLVPEPLEEDSVSLSACVSFCGRPTASMPLHAALAGMCVYKIPLVAVSAGSRSPLLAGSLGSLTREIACR